MTAGLVAGCVAIQRVLEQLVSDGADGLPNGDGDGTGDGLPVVTLQVSNVTPQLNEEVLLTCLLVSGDSTSLSFDFEPRFGGLIVNEQAGTASFIVSETDIGVSRALTCTATNDVGTSAPSNEQVVIPTGT
jgi:hypothetical protein